MTTNHKTSHKTNPACPIPPGGGDWVVLPDGSLLTADQHAAREAAKASAVKTAAPALTPAPQEK